MLNGSISSKTPNRNETEIEKELVQEANKNRRQIFQGAYWCYQCQPLGYGISVCGIVRLGIQN